jgi:hypothetical protein
MLFTLGMNSKEMDQKYQDGLKLWDDGNLEEGAEVWANLARFGHMSSILKLARVFLDQRDFERAETCLKHATDQANPLVQSLELEISKERESEELRIEAAANLNASGEMLEELSKDESLYVRHNVAANPRISQELLKSLSRDPRALVRGAVMVTTTSSSLSRIS